MMRPVIVTQRTCDAVLGVSRRWFLDYLQAHPEVPRAQLGRQTCVRVDDWLAHVAALLRSQADALQMQAQTLRVSAAMLEAGDDTDRDRFVRVTTRTQGVVPGRVANAAAASGAIKRATKRGKFWIAPEREIDAWLASESRRPADGAEALAASWGAR